MLHLYFSNKNDVSIIKLMLTISKLGIADFPRFTPCKLELFEYYQDFLFTFSPHCDFSLNNLLIWFGADNVKFSSLKGNLVLYINEALYTNQLGGSWYTILGASNASEALDEFFDSGLAKELVMVPDYFVSSITNQKRWKITEDVNNRDYILDIPSLLHKRGKLYENFRYQVSYFLKNHSQDSRLQDLDLSDPDVKKEILHCLKSWQITSFGAKGNDRERTDERAIKRLFALQPILLTKHRCIGLYIGDELAGFSIFHTSQTKHPIGLGNHIKYNSQYKRMFDFLVFATASRLSTEGIRFLNAEQDMGLHGIRHHKKYLNPITYYKKYNIKPIVD